MTMPAWNPDQYHRYGDPRLGPALEPFARVPLDDPSLVHDIGTGGGEIARLMTQRWPHARVIGSESSPEMLTRAAAEPSSVESMLPDLTEWHSQRLFIVAGP